MIRHVFELISYGLEKKLIDKVDCDYAVNRLAYKLEIAPKPFERVNPPGLQAIMQPIIKHAVTEGLIGDSLPEKDNLESDLFDVLTPMPSVIQDTFDALPAKEATEYLYNLCRHNQYIKTERIKRNKHFAHDSKYGTMKITINLSKPEKDPKTIAKLRKTKSTSYPKCLLCKENVGFYGHLSHPGRSNHRTITMTLNGEPFHFQYSPYLYYNEHAIVLHESHIPMDVGRHTFERLFDFVERFPHYFLGSNAGLPIVGGSILDHEHYQGGRAVFPIDHAEVIRTYEKHGVTYEILHWPLSIVRMKSTNRKTLTDEAERLRRFFLDYSDPAINLLNETGERHNAITPVARFEGGVYTLTIALRNNRTSDTHPDGIFHPHRDVHVIKKENIGLIEVMGLAILPGRLESDLAAIADTLKQGGTFSDTPAPYKEWVASLDLDGHASYEDALKSATARTFVKGLEDCGIFKMTKTGLAHFETFMEAYLDD